MTKQESATLEGAGGLKTLQSFLRSLTYSTEPRGKPGVGKLPSENLRYWDWGHAQTELGLWICERGSGGQIKNQHLGYMRVGEAGVRKDL